MTPKRSPLSSHRNNLKISRNPVGGAKSRSPRPVKSFLPAILITPAANPAATSPQVFFSADFLCYAPLNTISPCICQTALTASTCGNGERHVCRNSFSQDMSYGSFGSTGTPGCDYLLGLTLKTGFRIARTPTADIRAVSLRTGSRWPDATTMIADAMQCGKSLPEAHEPARRSAS